MKEVAKEILRDAKRKIEEGRAPISLGTQGLVALMWDKFQRYARHGDNIELLDAASDALIIYASSQPPGSPVSEDHEGVELPTVECPKCGVVAVCTIIPDAVIPICDNCVEEFGLDDEGSAKYEHWVKEVTGD